MKKHTQNTKIDGYKLHYILTPSQCLDILCKHISCFSENYSQSVKFSDLFNINFSSITIFDSFSYNCDTKNFLKIKKNVWDRRKIQFYVDWFRFHKIQVKYVEKHSVKNEKLRTNHSREILFSASHSRSFLLQVKKNSPFQNGWPKGSEIAWGDEKTRTEHQNWWL